MAQYSTSANDARVSRSVSRGVENKKSRLQTAVVVRALIESAAVTWIGLLIYEIASLAPTGGITVCKKSRFRVLAHFAACRRTTTSAMSWLPYSPCSLCVLRSIPFKLSRVQVLNLTDITGHLPDPDHVPSGSHKGTEPVSGSIVQPVSVDA